tara:strand:+ start:1497 stop:2072 length:576 start_codon:yes stop_codon:yes gene_type:complete
MIYSGPLLYGSKLNSEDIKKLISLCKKDKAKEANSKLVGLIDHEYDIDQTKFENIFNKYVDGFSIAYKNWYNVDKTPPMQISDVWVNYMKAGECNPPHMHQAAFSSVFYLKVPKGLKKEVEKCKANHTWPGAIQFLFNNPTVPNTINSYQHLPEAGDFFIFPGSLMHCVNSFQSSGERISIAANFIFPTKN